MCDNFDLQYWYVITVALSSADPNATVTMSVQYIYIYKMYVYYMYIECVGCLRTYFHYYSEDFALKYLMHNDPYI